MNRTWWLSGLNRHASNSSSDRCSGPRFKSMLGITIYVTYNIKPSADAIRHAQCAEYCNNSNIADGLQHKVQWPRVQAPHSRKRQSLTSE